MLPLLLLAACGGAGAGKGASTSGEPTHEERIRRGLELGEGGDYGGALSEFQLVQREAPSPLGSLRLACARFLLGRHAEALAGYRHYLEHGQGLSAQERMALAAEIARIERALDEDRKPEGPSLAGQWFRGELARLRADEAMAGGDFAGARAGYDEAFGLLGYPEFLFEAALAASSQGENRLARDRYAEFLRLGGQHLPPERAFAVAAEVDRLEAILRGEAPVTDESLAASVLAERAGKAAPEAPPPSAAADAATPEPPPGPVAAAPEPPPAETQESSYRPVEVPPERADVAPPRVEPKPVPLEDLLFYARSRSSAVRHRAVRDLARLADDRARRALEERVLEDQNRYVRFAAVEGLVARRSRASIPVLRRALNTAATSEERAVLKRALAGFQE
jgi:tetratricopeptide (TPR) repeat protein